MKPILKAFGCALAFAGLAVLSGAIGSRILGIIGSLGAMAGILGVWVLALDFAEHAGREAVPRRGLAAPIGLWPLRVTGLFWVASVSGGAGLAVGTQMNWPIVKSGAGELFIAGLGARALHFAFLVFRLMLGKLLSLARVVISPISLGLAAAVLAIANAVTLGGWASRGLRVSGPPVIVWAACQGVLALGSAVATVRKSLAGP
jgi:hypothetical protein